MYFTRISRRFRFCRFVKAICKDCLTVLLGAGFSETASIVLWIQGFGRKVLR